MIAKTTMAEKAIISTAILTTIIKTIMVTHKEIIKISNKMIIKEIIVDAILTKKKKRKNIVATKKVVAFATFSKVGMIFKKR